MMNNIILSSVLQSLWEKLGEGKIMIQFYEKILIKIHKNLAPDALSLAETTIAHINHFTTMCDSVWKL